MEQFERFAKLKEINDVKSKILAEERKLHSLKQQEKLRQLKQDADEYALAKTAVALSSPQKVPTH